MIAAGDDSGLSTRDDTTAPQRPRVLLVEDEQPVRELLGQSLSDEFEVETAADGEQALRSVLRLRPDLIVTDIVMPSLDGVELVRILRNNPSTAAIPILLTSGRAPDELRIEGFEVGADSYLPKPYTERELRVRIRSMLRTTRRRDEISRIEALEKSIAERAALLESITDAFFAVDGDGRFIYLNQRAIDFFEQRRATLIGVSLFEVIDVSRHGDAFQRVIKFAHEKSLPVVLEAIDPGSGRWLELHAYPSGLGVTVNFRDITERKQAEEVLRHSEGHFRKVADAVPVLMWRGDVENRGTWFNKTWTDFTGRTLEEELGFGWGETIHPDDLQNALRTYQASLDTRAPLETEFRMRRYDGEYRWMLDRGNPVFDGPGGTFTGYVGTCIDITELKRSEAALLAADERYRTLVTTSAEGIWRYELDIPTNLAWPPETQFQHLLEHGRFAELNGAMARMLGFEHADQVAGKPLSAVFSQDDETARALLMQAIDAKFQLQDAETTRIGPDGQTYYFENSTNPVVSDGHLLRIWGIRRDVTDRRRSEMQMLEAEKRKDEFVATLAHELRNPLAPIRNGIHILKLRTASLDPSTGQVLSMMDRQMRHLVRLVDDLLDISRVSRGRLTLKRQPVLLADILTAAIEATSVLFEARQHRLDVIFEKRSLIVDGDTDRLTQIFTNLLSNSAKYTPSGGVIELRVAPEADEVAVSVTDNGIGIPPQSLPKVFEMFSQVRAHQKNANGGLGIGLALVRTLVQMHGGTITAQSAGTDQGSTFTVRLPVARSAAQLPSTSAADASAPNTRGLRILVVDDNADAVNSLAMLLKESDQHVVWTATSGKDAIAAASQFLPDVIFMDIGMPQMDGIEATRQIRAIASDKPPWIVALTGWGQPADRQRSQEAGMNAHLVKPVAPEILRQVLDDFSARASGSSASA